MASAQLVIKNTFWELELVENDAEGRRSASLPPAQQKNRRGGGQNFKESCCSEHAKQQSRQDSVSQASKPDLDKLDVVKMQRLAATTNQENKENKDTSKRGRALASSKKGKTRQGCSPDVEELLALKNKLHQALSSSTASSMQLNHIQHLEAAMVCSVLSQRVAVW